MIKSKLLQKVIGWLVVVSVGVLFYFTLVSNWDNVSHLDLRPDIWVVIALTLFVLSVVSSGFLWGQIIRKLTGKNISKSEIVAVHLSSWLLKYIPGQAGSLVNKLSWGARNKIDKKIVFISFIYENAFLFFASTIPTIPIIALSFTDRFAEGIGLFIGLIIAIPLVSISLMPSILHRLLNKIFRLIKKNDLDINQLLSANDSTKYIFKFIIPRILNGAAFVSVAMSMNLINYSEFIVFASIYVLAGIVGILAIFVPSGLGVREGVIVLFCSPLIGVEQATALALVARLYATSADIIIGALYGFIRVTIRN